ncbi:MAG: SpoIIE family protein phosphatase [Pseudomonadales bacterium]|nr:SpoIIE family protein phosphatase [Pseudomonadales bacterium]
MQLTEEKAGAKIKVLVADDNESDRMILSSIINRQGHEVLTAADGQEALEVFEKERPQIVLLDAIMPKMDGMEAARFIKKSAGDEFIPVLFLTSLQDANSLADCLDAGGDDFLSKPYSQIILQAKLNAFLRMRSMHATMQSQRDEIAQHHRHLLREQKVAKAVFDNVAHSGCLNSPNIKYMLSPLAMFNGDVLLAAHKPSGGMHVLLGDFTGHGLPAAIGAMPMAEIFYFMTSKGFSITDIIAEINMNLKSILPVGVFCCACMADFSFEKQILRIWSGGLPESYLYRSHRKKIERIPSKHLALGILSPDDFDTELQVIEMPKGDRFFMCSDGISEAMNSSGEMFGEERMIAAIEDSSEDEEIFTAVQNAVTQFMGEQQRDDDITLVEVKMIGDFELQNPDSGFTNATQSGPQDWSMEYELGPNTLRDFNPLPLMLQIVMEVPGLRPYSGQIYTILAELFSNALEHGVLGLDSELKSTASGFIQYYEERTAQLEILESGYVRFKFTHIPNKEGGVLSIRLEDSGEGFNIDDTLSIEVKRGGYSGRGVPLVRSLSDSVEYFGAGNAVEVSYVWQFD